jgi:DmsE family decaheme c-type cytochrome
VRVPGPFDRAQGWPEFKEVSMSRFRPHLGTAGWMVGAVAIWLVAVASASGTSAASTDATPVKAQPAAVQSGNGAAHPADQYAGEETCLTCHEDQKKGYEGSAHARAADPRSPAAAKGCESCHGPGKAHAEAGGDKALIKKIGALSPSEQSEGCLTCHNRGDHAEWEGSPHDARNVSCLSCHSVHAPKSEKAQLTKVTQVETCVQCHKQEVNKLRRSAHMPVREGKMECSSCHNPHGSTNVRMLREGNSVNESCVSCHAEKRGPFLYEHAVGRENCTTCHDPHGSNNERMLVAKQPMLCQRCHVHSRHPATVYDATQVANKSNRAVSRSCLNCHVAIHGSNHPSGKAFTR